MAGGSGADCSTVTVRPCGPVALTPERNALTRASPAQETSAGSPAEPPGSVAELPLLRQASSRQLPSRVVRRWATDPSDRQPWDGVPASGEPVKPLPVWVDSEHSTTDTIEG